MIHIKKEQKKKAINKTHRNSNINSYIQNKTNDVNNVKSRKTKTKLKCNSITASVQWIQTSK